MKCFEIRKCSEEERARCFVYSAYVDKKELEGVKCWIMNGAFQRGNRAQLEQCLACEYYKAMNKDSGVRHAEASNASIISIVGAINNDRAQALDGILNQFLEKKRVHVVLNLKDVNNIYSCGLGTIIRMHKDLQAAGGGLALACTQPYVETILESVKLNRFLRLFPKEAEAVAFLEEKVQGKRKVEEKAKVSAKVEEERAKKKELPCWEYWNNHNPKNANKCDECFRKNKPGNSRCWMVEGVIEGVSFQYVNEDCENCEYYLLHQDEAA